MYDMCVVVTLRRTTMQCIRTMPCDYALCCVFAPGDRHVVVGTKSGSLQIYDIAAGLLLETIEAHGGVTWSICLSPDQVCCLLL